MIFPDIDFEYHSHLSTTPNLTLNKRIFLRMLGEEISFEGYVHKYSCVLLNPYASQCQPEIVFEKYLSEAKELNIRCLSYT